jgi:CHC2 zinc finger
MATASAFQKQLLPPASVFYAAELGKLTRPSRGWSRGRCPFHDSKSGVSFSVNLDTGGFYCFGCGARGGDLVDFVQLRDRCDFTMACKRLGAWHDLGDCRNADFQRELDARKRQQERIEAAADKWATLERTLRLECRDRIHDTERKHLQVSARLAELFRGEAERFPGEEEALWLKLQAAAALLNSDLASYTLLSFGALEARAQFVLRPALRDEIIGSVRWSGFVRTSDGKRVEVLA